MKRFGMLAAALCALMFLLPVQVWADDVVDQINEALSAYKNKDNETALIALETAMGLIRQVNAETMSTYLPEPMEGWNAEEADASYAAAGMMGGGSGTSRFYTHDTEEDQEQVTLTIVADSPMIQTFGMMISNPMMAGGGKIMIVKGIKAIYNKDENSYKAVINNKILVTAEGNSVAKPEDVKTYFSGIDFKALSKK